MSGWSGAAFPSEDIKALRRAYRMLADKALNFSQAVEKIAETEDAANAHVKVLMEFLRTTQRGVVRPEGDSG
jgi:acyl-[acyl carrier protein]--UDP-N-acetylglucosamine O-acyltransferase